MNRSGSAARTPSAAGIVQPSGPAWPQLIQWRGLNTCRNCAAGDLRQADRADIAGVAAERLVHLLVDALRLDRHVVEMRLAQHRLLAVPAFGGPAGPVGQAAFGLARPRDLDEQFQRRLGVRDDAVIRVEHAADLRRLDVDVNEVAALGVDLDRPGVAVGPAVADAEHEVGGEQRGVAVAMAGLQSDHARHQTMVVGDRPPAHQRRNDRNAGQLGELDQQIGSVGVDDAAARDDQRPFRRRAAYPAPSRPAPASRAACRPAAARRSQDRTRSRPSARRTAGRSAPGRAGPNASGGTPAGRRAARALARAPSSPIW